MNLLELQVLVVVSRMPVADEVPARAVNRQSSGVEPVVQQVGGVKTAMAHELDRPAGCTAGLTG